MEIWKDVPNYNGDYQVSNLGRVKSIKRKKEKILKPGVDGGRYLCVNLYKNSILKNFKIHSLVAMCFLGHKTDGTHKIVIDHINNIKTDNRVENLQLITNRENTSKDRKGCSSNFTGVSWSKSANKWRSLIYNEGKLNHLGYYTCELKAAIIYQKSLKTINK
jgi:hypothetical protein